MACKYASGDAALDSNGSNGVSGAEIHNSSWSLQLPVHDDLVNV